MPQVSSLLLLAFYVGLLAALALPAFLLLFALSPTFQSLLIHMHWVNFPFPLLTDFTQPTKAQWLSKPLPCASYVRTAVNTSSVHPLAGWLISPLSRCPSAESPSDLRCSSVAPFAHPVLYLHGNAENRAYHRSHERFRFLTDFPLCADVFVFDYRGFAENRGFPTQEGLEEDARAMLATVEGWNGGIAAADIVVYGHSLGSAVAIHLLDHRIQQGLPTPRSLIVEGAFTSVIDNAMSYLPTPLASWSWLRESLSRSLRHPWITSSLIPLQSGAVSALFLHGRKDSTISYWNVQRLWGQLVSARGCEVERVTNDVGEVERCGSDVLVSVDKAHHYDALSFPIAQQAVIRFIDDTLDRPT